MVRVVSLFLSTKVCSFSLSHIAARIVLWKMENVCENTHGGFSHHNGGKPCKNYCFVEMFVNITLYLLFWEFRWCDRGVIFGFLQYFLHTQKKYSQIMTKFTLHYHQPLPEFHTPPHKKYVQLLLPVCMCVSEYVCVCVCSGYVCVSGYECVCSVWVCVCSVWLCVLCGCV